MSLISGLSQWLKGGGTGTVRTVKAKMISDGRHPSLDLVVFDIGSVVVHNWQTLGRIAARYHLDETELVEDYANNESPLMEGTITTKAWWSHVCDKFRLDDLARTRDPLDDEFHCRPDMAVVAVIRKLKEEGFHVVAGSNTCAPHWKKMEASAGLAALFDRCYLSHELHIAKPAPQFFRSILEAERVDAAHALFIDDTKKNVDAAGGVGMQTLWYRTDAAWSALDRLKQRFGLLDAQLT